MLALASAPQGSNPTLVLIIIAAVVVAFFWRAILKVAIAALIIGFVFLLVDRPCSSSCTACTRLSPSRPEEPG